MSFLSIRIQHTSTPSKLTLTEDNDTYTVSNATGSIYLRLKKRMDYPRTFCRLTDASTVDFGYGDEVMRAHSEFVHGSLDADGTVVMTRDAFGTLPIFYYGDDTSCVVDSVYSEVVASMPKPKLSTDGFVAALSLAAPLPLTCAAGVMPLWPDEQLRYSHGQIHVTLLAERAWQASADVPATEPRDFATFFTDYLEYFIADRLDGQYFAYELSGGLDSATLPQYYYQTRQLERPAAAMILPGEQQAYHHHKVAALAQATKSSVIYEYLDSDVSFPLARLVNSQQKQPLYFEKTYLEPTESYVRQLAAQGVRVICTGVGGDELFGNTPGAEHSLLDNAYLPFATEQYKMLHDALFDRYGTPRHRLSRSVVYGTLCNNVYIEHGIWPVSPFIDPDLYMWVQGLAPHYRDNKNILRAYHQARRFEPEIYDTTHNETFTDFFSTCFARGHYTDYIHDVAQHSVAARCGYIDATQAVALYQAALHPDAPHRDETFFAVYIWLLAEINAQTLDLQTKSPML